LVILADGKSALAADRPAPSGDFGIKSHWVGVVAAAAPPDAIELFGVNGHYGGIAPVESGEFNISFSVPAERVRKFGGDLDSLFAAIAQENVTLQARLHGARRVGPWHAAPLPRFGVRSAWPARVIPVGNAAAAIGPIGGEGMGLAIRSAQLAAGAILAAARRGREIDTAALRRQYKSLWNTRRLACRMLARVLSRPRLAPAVVALAESAPALPRLALHLIGK
jgi:2-polyprenyl-6-methoxyphenol hydroxylase-like FAD-dependent oxidoreductase